MDAFEAAMHCTDVTETALPVERVFSALSDGDRYEDVAKYIADANEKAPSAAEYPLLYFPQDWLGRLS